MGVVSDRLRVTVLGCGGCYAGPGGACSGYLVRSATTSVWFDCGPGTFANLQEHMDPRELDAIVVSHHHPDHCLELPVVYNALRYYIPVDSMAVHATSGVKEMCESLAGDGDTSDVFDWTIHRDGDVGGGADPGVHDHRDVHRFDDQADVDRVAQAQAAPNGGAQGHLHASLQGSVSNAGLSRRPVEHRPRTLSSEVQRPLRTSPVLRALRRV